MISTNMDKTVKPCDNFYEFVCGKEIRNPNWQSVFLDHKAAFVQRAILSLRSVEAPEKNQTAAEKAARLYQACESVAKGKHDELDRFKDILRKSGIEWPRQSQQPDVLLPSLRIQKALDVSTLFSIKYVHLAEPVVVLGPGAAIGVYSVRRDRRLKRGSYEEYFHAFREAFKTPDDDEASLLSFSNFSNTEKTVLSELLGKVRGNITTLAGVGELATRTPEISRNRWDTLLKEGFGISDTLPVAVHVNSIAYLQAFSSLFATLGEQELALYAGWLTIQDLAPLMNSYLANLWYGSSQEAANDTPWRCAELAEWYLGWAVWLPRVRSVFTEDVLKDIHSMISAVYTSLKLKLQTNTWMISGKRVPPFEDISRTMALVDTPEAAIDAMYTNVPDMSNFVSDNIVNAVKSRERTSITVLAIIGTAYVRAQGYSINIRRAVSHIPPFAATLPMYDYNVTEGVKYGALGSVLAAPFFAFLYDSLMEEALKLFRCYLDTAPLANLETSYFDRTVSFGILWDAYKAAKGSAAEARLYGFTEYTEDQVFFMAFCHMVCSVRIEAEHFCNEPLRNTPRFAESYQCSEGSRMNPEAKCSLL